MTRFSIRNPYFVVVVCLLLTVIGVTSLARMPIDLFPTINLPEVVVATFYSGMPPEDIETDITDPLERFFTLASGIDHMESRSLLGVSIIKVYFQPGTNADADVTELSNLAMADLKRLPPGTLPPVVLKFDASSLPVCLVTLKGEGLNQTQLHDIGQFTIRNQIAVVQGAEIPPPFGGKYRQIMVYVDPYKLASRQLSPMDVVTAVNNSNLILPAGDVKMGPFDYYVYSNSLVDDMDQLSKVPVKTVGNSWVTVDDIGKAEDANQIQYNVVRVDGQRSVYLPIMKQGGDTNTIAVVQGIRDAIEHLYDIPKQLKSAVVFDQSAFVKEAIKTLLHEGVIGLALTSLMILIFLGSFRATSAVFLSIPLSALATFVVLYMRRQHHQHDDSWWAGAGILAHYRQLSDLAGKHLPASGAWRRTYGCCGGGRLGGEPRRAGCNADHGGCLLSGHLSFWRQQVPVFGAGARGCHLVVRVVRSCDDRDSAVLFAILAGCSAC